MAIKDLIIHDAEINEEVLEVIVKRYFFYEKSGKIIITNPKFYKLTGEKKILYYLTGILGRKFLNLKRPSTDASNLELKNRLKMNHSSVRVYVSRLKNRGLVKTQGKQHLISSLGIHELQKEVKK